MDQDLKNSGYSERELEEMLRPNWGSRITSFVGKWIVIAVIVGLVVLASWTILTLVHTTIIAMSYCILLICLIIQIVCVYLIQGADDEVSIAKVLKYLSFSGSVFLAFFFWGNCVLGEYVELEFGTSEDKAFHLLNYHILGPFIVACFFSYIPYLIAETYSIVYASFIRPLMRNLLLSSYKDLKSSEFDELKSKSDKGLELKLMESITKGVAYIVFIGCLVLVYACREGIMDYLPYLFNFSCGGLLVLCVFEALIKLVHTVKIKRIVSCSNCNNSILSHYETGLLQVLLLCKPKEIKNIRFKNEKQRQEWLTREISDKE